MKTSFKYILKITFLYASGIYCLILVDHLKNSERIAKFLKQAENTRADWSFEIFIWATLINKLLPITGIAIIMITTFLLIKKHTTLLSRFYKD